MKFLQIFIVTLVASLATSALVQSLALGQTGSETTGTTHQIEQNQQGTTSSVKPEDKPQTPPKVGGNSGGRYLSNIGGFEGGYADQSGYGISQPYIPPIQSYEQPISQVYQQPSYSNYSAPSYSTPSYSPPAYSPPPAYTQPPTYSNYSTPTYSAPVTSSYVAPVTSSYSTPVTSSYSTPSYSAPITPSYSAPIIPSYSAPVIPSYSNYTTTTTTQSYAPQVSSYTPQVSSYTPQVSTYTPPVSSYTPPVQTYTPQVSTYTPQVSTYTPPVQSYSNYTTSTYSTPTYSTPTYSNYSTPTYTPPVQTYTPPVSTYTPQVSSYTPQVSSYTPQVSSYTPQVSSYSTPQVPSYTPQVSSYTPQVSSYTPQVSSYTPQVSSYTPQVSSYTPPVQTYAPQVQSYQQPTQYETPVISNYTVPIPTVSTYGTETYSQQPIQSYGQQPIQTYGQQQTYSAPIQQSYSAPIQQTGYAQSSYQPTSSYVAPIQQSTYSAPIQQSYGQQQSYSAPIQQGYGQSYVQPQYQGSVAKRELIEPKTPATISTVSAGTESGLSSKESSAANASSGVLVSTLIDQEASASESSVQATYLTPPPAITASYQQSAYKQQPIVIQPVVQQPLVQQSQKYVQQQQPQSTYLDTQPEFTQSWADFNIPPGFLPSIFKTSLLPYQQQFKGSNSIVNDPYGPQSIGFGYLVPGPINPATFYTPVQLPYYYQIPPPTPFFLPSLGSSQLTKPIVPYPIGNQQQAAAIQVAAVPSSAGYSNVNNQVIYKAQPYLGVSKRGLTHEIASPYQLLVDHLAAASEGSAVAVNTTNFECPAKQTDYTCPKLLTKDELKAKICQYESVVSGKLNLMKDSDKAQTNCGGFKVEKQAAKCPDESSDLSEQLAVVLGKECTQLKPILEASSKNETLHLLLSSAYPAGTKFVLLDGAKVDLIDSKLIGQDELIKLLQQCPKQQGPQAANATKPTGEQAKESATVGANASQIVAGRQQ